MLVNNYAFVQNLNDQINKQFIPLNIYYHHQVKLSPDQHRTAKIFINSNNTNLNNINNISSNNHINIIGNTSNNTNNIISHKPKIIKENLNPCDSNRKFDNVNVNQYHQNRPVLVGQNDVALYTNSNCENNSLMGKVPLRCQPVIQPPFQNESNNKQFRNPKSVVIEDLPPRLKKKRQIEFENSQKYSQPQQKPQQLQNQEQSFQNSEFRSNKNLHKNHFSSQLNINQSVQNFIDQQDLQHKQRRFSYNSKFITNSNKQFTKLPSGSVNNSLADYNLNNLQDKMFNLNIKNNKKSQEPDYKRMSLDSLTNINKQKFNGNNGGNTNLNNQKKGKKFNTNTVNDDQFEPYRLENDPKLENEVNLILSNSDHNFKATEKINEKNQKIESIFDDDSNNKTQETPATETKKKTRHHHHRSKRNNKKKKKKTLKNSDSSGFGGSAGSNNSMLFENNNTSSSSNNAIDSTCGFDFSNTNEFWEDDLCVNAELIGDTNLASDIMLFLSTSSEGFNLDEEEDDDESPSDSKESVENCVLSGDNQILSLE